MAALVQTQAVECFAEWSLTPENLAFKRIREGICDPVIIGDKARWFAHHLRLEQYTLCPEEPVSKLFRMLQQDQASHSGTKCLKPARNRFTSICYIVISRFKKQTFPAFPFPANGWNSHSKFVKLLQA